MPAKRARGDTGGDEGAACQERSHQTASDPHAGGPLASAFFSAGKAFFGYQLRCTLSDLLAEPFTQPSVLRPGFHIVGCGDDPDDKEGSLIVDCQHATQLVVLRLRL